MTRSNDSLKVIVVGIPKTLDDAGLQDLFGAYGSVADAKVVKDAATDVSRGFGFVTFTAQSAMRRAVKEMDKKQLEGRTLNVRQLVAKDQLVKKDSDKSNELAQRPCYLLRKGKCTKGDRCPFSHEIKSGEFGSCFEFVQNGECKRGDNCKFFHPPPATEDGEAAEGTKDDGEREFEPPSKKKDTKPIEKKPVADEKKKPADGKKQPKGGEKDDKPRYCFAFQSGRCHRGKRCLYLHEKLVVPENEAPPAAAPVERKRPGDFEVVKDEEPSKKRRRDSDDEDSDADEVPAVKPAAKAKTVEKKVVEKKVIEKKVVEKKPIEKKESQAKTKPSGDEKPAKADKPAVDENGKPIHTGPKPVCRHFLKGLCKRGHICFFRHEQPTEEELKELLPLIKGGKNKVIKKGGDDDDDEDDEDATPLQAVADHMSSFMASFDASKPFEPFVPSAMPAVDSSVDKEETVVEASRVPKRKASVESEETFQEEEQNEQPPAFKRQRKEKIDMGAAFDGAESDDDRPGPKRGGKKRKPTKEEMKASREKLRAERRAKKSSKLMARERLKTQGEIEFS